MAARNVLLTHDLNAKVADFGLSSRIYVTLEEELVKGSNQDTVPYRWAAYETLFLGETIKGEKNLNTTTPSPRLTRIFGIPEFRVTRKSR